MSQYKYVPLSLSHEPHHHCMVMSCAVHTRDRSPQSELGDVWTCRTTLASAYVLYPLSTIWSQLQIEGRSLRRIGMLLLNTSD